MRAYVRQLVNGGVSGPSSRKFRWKSRCQSAGSSEFSGPAVLVRSALRDSRRWYDCIRPGLCTLCTLKFSCGDSERQLCNMSTPDITASSPHSAASVCKGSGTLGERDTRPLHARLFMRVCGGLLESLSLPHELVTGYLNGLVISSASKA
jgi:hypothetical protein